MQWFERLGYTRSLYVQLYVTGVCIHRMPAVIFIILRMTQLGSGWHGSHGKFARETVGAEIICMLCHNIYLRNTISSRTQD